MRKLHVYLDTSVINFLFADDAPEKRDATCDFFETHIDGYNVAISDIVLVEISRTQDECRRRILEDAVDTYKLLPVELTDAQAEEVESLADAYIRLGVIPPGQRDDAMHVAICTVLEFDVLLSWNFQHLANIKKQIRINTANQSEGYLKPLLLLTPLELMGDETDNE